MLTRDFLMKADCKTAFGAIEESLLWSAEQRAASLAATLACRPDDGPVWIFGYGSLMWNPALEFVESATGTLLAGIAHFVCASRPVEVARVSLDACLH